VSRIAFDPTNLIFISSDKPKGRDLGDSTRNEEFEDTSVPFSTKLSLLQPSDSSNAAQTREHLEPVNLATLSLIESSTEYKYLEMGQDTYMTLLINKKNIESVVK